MIDVKKVGVVPSAKLFETDDYYEDAYNFHNNYCARIIENGGVPLGIVGKDGYALEESLDCCDSFIIGGGRKIFPYHFQVVEHAVRNNKPLLGICLGMQVIHSYFIVAEEAKKRCYKKDLLKLYVDMKKEHYMFVEPVAHHWDTQITRKNIEEVKHQVAILPNTLLSKYFPSATIMGASMHHYRIVNPSDQLITSAYAKDGTIEGIELAPYIIGIQFHPEVDNKTSKIFELLTK